MKRRVIIIHGTGGNQQGNWFPWLATELKSESLEVVVPQFPTPEGQDVENWFRVLEGVIGKLGASDILIGHSIGAAFVLRILEKLREPIFAAFLVAGFARQIGNKDFDPFNKTFVEHEFDWMKIKDNAQTFKSYVGNNDPYVPMELGLEVGEKLGILTRVVANGGHLNAGSGYLKFELLRDDLLACLN